MILKPTVLILGAGASKPYGYPLGDELVAKIIQLTAPAAALTGILSEDPGVFHNRLRDSGVASIDDFLESNPKFASLGKIGISACLTVWGPSFDHPLDPPGGWYKYLWNRLHEGAASPSEFRRNQLRIITYNYDTSFERYFTRVLGSMYPELADLGRPAAAEFLREVIWITHLHGTVANDDLVRREPNREAFLKLDFIKDAAAGIRIVHEDESPEYKKAHTWLGWAERVYVLGFGYHPTNVRRLDLVSQYQKKEGGWQAFGGTGLGFEDAEVNRINNALQLGNFLQSVDCLTYLRRHARLE